MVAPTLQLPGYRVSGSLGRGGFGVVHAAERASDGRPVAIKVLHRVLDEVEGRRFAAEIQVMGTLAWHPGIVGILDAGEVEGQPYIVMERLAGGSLGDRLRDGGPLSPDQVTAAGIQAATGLQVAHNAGLLHRDIKPDNLLVAEDGSVKVSDFGVTLAAGAAGRRRGTTGTVAFAAPELLAGAGATTATDVYALGATLFALVNGEPAYHRDTDESPAAMILRAHREPVPDLVGAGVPEPLARAIRRAMSKDPAERPARAEDLARELAAARDALGLASVAVVAAGRAAPGPLPAPAAAVGLPDQPPVEARRKAQRLQRVLGGVGAAAAALIAVTFVATGFLGGDAFDGDTAPDSAAEEEFVVPDVEQPGEAAPDDEPAPAEEAPAPAPTPTPSVAATAPPVPAPAPVPPTATGASEPAGLLDFADVVTAVTGQDGLLVVATGAELLIIDPYAATPDRATLNLSGAVDVALVGDTALVTLAGGPPVLVRPATVAGLTSASITAVDAPELAGAEGGAVESALGRFWVATRDGVVAIDPSGAVTASVAAPGITHVAAAAAGHADRPVLWVGDDQGTVLAIDAADGAALQRFTLGSLRRLAVDADSRAWALMADGRLAELSPDGSARRSTTTGILDVAAALQGPPLVLTVDGVGILGPNDEVTIISTEAFTGLAQVGGEVYGVTADGRSVRVLR